MRTWILGAGFSRRLGGPLLNDLLTSVSLETLRHRHPNTWLNEEDCDLCVLGLEQGRKQGWWSNAEEYIASLGSLDPTHAKNFDSAISELASFADARKRYRTLSPYAPSFRTPEGELLQHCWTTAIRLVAAQCIDFVERSKGDPEGWLAYDRWVKCLPKEDVLITFNYDNVIELLFERSNRPLVTPNPRLGQPAQRTYKDCQMLLKLHGGVDFRDTILKPREPDNIMNLQRNPACIAVPGRSKSDSSSVEFGELWDLASQALTECDSISIVGYSCPATDEMSKAMLIDSVSANKKKPEVELVLGGDQNAANRLQALLGRFVNVRNTHLFAQDYLSVHGVGAGWAVSDIFPGMFD